MITDIKEIAKRLRTEADYWRDFHEDDIIFDMSNCVFTESVLTVFGIDDLDMPVYDLFAKLADLIDSQER